MRFILLLILLLTANASMPDENLADENRDIQQAVTSFYTVYLEIEPLGVPTEKEREKFKPHVSTALGQLLQEADQAEQNYHQATEGEAPPLAQGDLFTSLFEGAISFTVLSCEQQTDTGSCLVEFIYTDQGNQSPVQWRDQVYVFKESLDWRVDDIEYPGDWQFMHKGRLRELLKQVIAEGNA